MGVCGIALSWSVTSFQGLFLSLAKRRHSTPIKFALMHNIANFDEL